MEYFVKWKCKINKVIFCEVILLNLWHHQYWCSKSPLQVELSEDKDFECKVDISTRIVCPSQQPPTKWSRATWCKRPQHVGFGRPTNRLMPRALLYLTVHLKWTVYMLDMFKDEEVTVAVTVDNFWAWNIA